MAIIGIGMDILEIARIQTSIACWGDRLARKILRLSEWNSYQQHHQPVRFLAKHFAVKEAASKAMGTGFRDDITFIQFEMFHDTLGKPSLRLFAKAKQLANQLGVNSIFVTLTDEKCYVCSTVIFEN